MNKANNKNKIDHFSLVSRQVLKDFLWKKKIMKIFWTVNKKLTKSERSTLEIKAWVSKKEQILSFLNDKHLDVWNWTTKIHKNK